MNNSPTDRPSSETKKDESLLSELRHRATETPFPAHLREACEAEFVQGQLVRRQGLVTGNTSNQPDTQTGRSRSSSEVLAIPVIEPWDPLVTTASVNQAKMAALAISRKLNFEPSKDLTQTTAEELTWSRWTVKELEIAVRVIVNDPKLAKEARYAGAVTPEVFAQAKQDIRVIAGRTMDHAEMQQLLRKYAGGRVDLHGRFSREAFRVVKIENRSKNRFHLHRPEVIMKSAMYAEVTNG